MSFSLRQIEELEDKTTVEEKPSLDVKKETFLKAMIELGKTENLAKAAWDHIDDKENMDDAEIEEEGDYFNSVVPSWVIQKCTHWRPRKWHHKLGIRTRDNKDKSLMQDSS